METVASVEGQGKTAHLLLEPFRISASMFNCKERKEKKMEIVKLQAKVVRSIE